MAILITGANRGLGLAIAKKLLKQNNELYVLGRDLNILKQTYAPYQDNITGYLTFDMTSVQSAMLVDQLMRCRNIERVFHCASPYLLKPLQQVSL